MLSIIRIGKWVMKRNIGYDFYIGGYCFFIGLGEKKLLYIWVILLLFMVTES